MHTTYFLLSLVLSAPLLSLERASLNEETLSMIPLTGKAWAETQLSKYPEIAWLADSDVKKTEEGQATLQGAYSEQIFGKKYIEFDRTLMTLHCLNLILEGDEASYQAFTASQPPQLKLSRESFKTLHLWGQTLLKSKWGDLSERDVLKTLQTALVLGDMGKSGKARALFKTYPAKAPDHDDFYGEAIDVLNRHPHLCPSFANLSPAGKKLLTSIANLAHYGHITHLEGDTGMFEKLKESGLASTDPIALSFDLFVHTCDVAGALGHVNNQSSLVYNEQTHMAMQAMAEAVRTLSDPRKTELDAYNAYLNTRASWLGLNSKDPLDRVLTRVGAMLRLFTPEEGAILKKALQTLDSSAQKQITTELDTQKENRLARTPTYMPAVLVNLANNTKLGNTKEERIAKAVTLGLPFLAKTLKLHRQALLKKEADATIPLNFNPIAGVAKESPEKLLKDATIDKEGSVEILPAKAQ